MGNGGQITRAGSTVPGMVGIPHRATSLSSLLGHAYTEHTHALVKVELSPINT